MTKRDQKRFVRELVTGIWQETVDKIKAGKIPETWDGIELREYLADKFGDARFRGTLLGKRKMDYHNTVLERNL